MTEPREHGLTDDLLDLLSEVWDADKQANNPRTREFLDAGLELLHGELARAHETPSHSGLRTRAPFDELLAFVSRRRVVDKAEQTWAAQHPKQGAKPSESAYRYRWRTQTGYLRDLVVYALRSRMASPEETRKAIQALFSDDPLDEVVARIAYDEVSTLTRDQAFRLQMVFQAILAHDNYVANALRSIDQTNVDAWKDFYQSGLDHLGLTLRPDVSLDDFAYALQAAAEGVVFRSLLSMPRSLPPAAHAIDHDSRTSRPLAIIAMALLVAFTDPGDGRELRQVVRDLPSRASG